MSHTVLRGEPSASQIYLDTILDAIINELKNKTKSKKRDEVNLAEIIYYSMKHCIDDIFMINGSNGECITNNQILQYSVPLAKALQARDEKDMIIMIMMRNSQHMACLYYATLFAGVVPLIIDSNSTTYEIQHFINLVSPSIIFCDRDREKDLKDAVIDISKSNQIVIVADDKHCLERFCEATAYDVDTFQVTDVLPLSTCLLLPTSGSSGLPKATVLSHKGLIAQLPVLWMQHDCFPKPTQSALLLSSAQWMTHTILMTTCPVYGVSLLMTPKKPTAEDILDIIDKYQPTWALLGPAFAQCVGDLATPSQIKSLKTVITTGSPLTPNVVKILKQKLPASCYFGSGVGMTETHGFFTIPGPKTPWESNDKVINTWYYKLINKNGEVLVTPEKGELLLKSRFGLFSGYYTNHQKTLMAMTADGWLLTGDIFYIDDKEDLHFIERKKFWFKYLNYHISPEELENVIGSITGVKECVVCESEKGPAAAVVLRENFSREEMSNKIHATINTTLSEHKQLRGGVAFVSSLPYTHSGKLKRKECKKLLDLFLSKGECF